MCISNFHELTSILMIYCHTFLQDVTRLNKLFKWLKDEFFLKMFRLESHFHNLFIWLMTNISMSIGKQKSITLKMNTINVLITCILHIAHTHTRIICCDIKRYGIWPFNGSLCIFSISVVRYKFLYLNRFQSIYDVVHKIYPSVKH